MAWVFLIVGGMFEIGWAFGLKFSNGFTNLPVSVITVILMVLSFWCFSKSLKFLPVSTAYAVFTGIGSFGTAVIGMIFLGDSVSVLKVLLLIILIICIIGLKLVSNESPHEEGEIR
ncbi:DMT family transporter [Priestia taiwanensis]|uniref:QacE family quaternary ammonium compound efflux SMR transporter n=1 Tax=Priestia taiwanensis TaxID=1347902 RepID=A0A917AN55_9BACI|nr:multidrug efflux SMR transporter [Priestia taiwanensis]MBM7362348.1 quaternary ammonium compound-resistance protein SugE [Priestia taiwanensis]GGE61428.1 QacE family quaternary ammonium compound efflux SMR transporter [Priestia taiwanensis]